MKPPLPPRAQAAFLALACLPSDPPPPGSFTIALLPDTQTYAQSFPAIFDAQTQWLRDNAGVHAIAYVLHLGDVTNTNSIAQWNVARSAMGNLDGTVPYAIAPGNHDYGPGGNASTRDSLFNDPAYFGPGTPYATQPSIGGFYEAGRTDNSWHTFQAGGRDWIVLALEWGPRDEVVVWADQVLSSHPDHTAILVTHAYMYFDETRYDFELRGGGQSWNPHAYGTAGLPGGVNDAQELWRDLVSKHEVAFVFNGHVLGDGTGRRIGVGDGGLGTHEMLSNYQSGVSGSVNGGNGFLRLIEVQPDGETVRVRSYSPVVDAYKSEPDQDFWIGLLPGPVDADHELAVVGEAPRLYWRLEREVGPYVRNRGAAAGGLSGTYTGPGPMASSYDGALARTETSLAFDGADAWTIDAWVRTEGTSAQTVLSNDRDGWNDDVLLGLGPEGGAISTPGRWAVIHQDDGSQSRTLVEAPVDAVVGVWTHLVATSDGAALRLYVDGELVGEAPASGADLAMDAAPLAAGRSFNSADSGRPFDGEIAEVAVFDRALDLSAITALRLAALNRVVAGALDTTGPADPGGNPSQVVGVSHDAFPGFGAPGSNEGDVRVSLAGRGLSARDGVLLASVAEIEKDGLHASVEVGWNSFNDGILTLAIMQAGFAPGGTGQNEVDFDTGVAWFPFAAGFRSAHVEGDGSLFEARGVSQADLSMTAPGRYLLDLGVDSRTDGLLFTVGGANDDNIVLAAVLPDGRGWDIRVQDNAHDFQMFSGDGEPDRFSFVYVPIDTPTLVGGRYDGFNDTALLAAGDAQWTRLGTGDYSLSIPGESPETGMLLLTVSRLPTSGGLTAPDDNVLSYTASGNAFRVQSRDLPLVNLQDTELTWAFVPWSRAEPALLAGAPGQVSLAAGGTQALELEAGAAQAGRLYLILGSSSGTAPGLAIDGLPLPLNVDAYTIATLNAPNTPPLSSSFGVLDPAGSAEAGVTVPAGTSASLAGVALHHAYVVIDVQPTLLQLLLASNAVSIDLVP